MNMYQYQYIAKKKKKGKQDLLTHSKASFHIPSFFILLNKKCHLQYLGPILGTVCQESYQLIRSD